MKHVVSFSGGRTSAYMVWWFEKNKNRLGWDVEYVFCDTGAEHPKTYEFIKKVVDNFGIELTVLKPVVHQKNGKGNTYQISLVGEIGFNMKMMKDHLAKYGNFTVNRPNCTDRMKSIINDKYKKDKHGKGNYQTWLGIRIDEPRRLKMMDSQIDAFDGVKSNPHGIHYLAEVSDFTKEDVLDFWDGQPFDLEIEEHLGNCVFCVKKGASKIALAQRDEPELYRLWNDAVTSEDVRLMPSDKFGTGKIYRGVVIS